uniref:PIK3AP1 Toll/interleukin-1 receptor domain-containing protein n=1 Tax=Anguilla anguilla TaxID=7936 RepID=A0A0E9TRU3_ANGAN
MVLLFCGVSENEMLEEHFQHWHAWRKLYSDDDPAVYVSTVLESISDGKCTSVVLMLAYVKMDSTSCLSSVSNLGVLVPGKFI